MSEEGEPTVPLVGGLPLMISTACTTSVIALRSDTPTAVISRRRFTFSDSPPAILSAINFADYDVTLRWGYQIICKMSATRS